MAAFGGHPHFGLLAARQRLDGGTAELDNLGTPTTQHAAQPAPGCSPVTLISMSQDGSVAGGKRRRSKLASESSGDASEENRPRQVQKEPPKGATPHEFAQ